MDRSTKAPMAKFVETASHMIVEDRTHRKLWKIVYIVTQNIISIVESLSCPFSELKIWLKWSGYCKRKYCENPVTIELPKLDNMNDILILISIFSFSWYDCHKVCFS
jgi:hypothetical protein